MRNRIFVCVCALFLIFVFLFAPCYRLLVGAGLAEYREMGNVIENETVREGFLAGPLNRVEDFKTVLRDTYINYLPGYVSLVTGYKDAEFGLNKPSVDWLTKLSEKQAAAKRAETPPAPQTPAETKPGETTAPPVEVYIPPEVTTTFITQDATHRYYDFTYTDKDGNQVSFLDRGVNRTSAQIKEVTARNLAHINRLAAVAEKKDVNFFFYACLRSQESDFCKDIMPTEVNLHPVFDGLVEGLSPNVHCDWFEMATVEDRAAQVYATDHHWNATGAHIGYSEIINMISEVEDIGKPKEPLKFYELSTCHFYGSCARKTGYMKYYDPFTFADYGLPEHQTTGGSPVYTKMEQYLNGMFSRDNGTAHYESFYGEVTKFVFPQNKTGRNLLIITDSFGKAVNEVIASHFDTTYAHYIWSKNQINLNSFIDQNKITDILIIQLSNRLLADVASDCHFENILTD